MSKDLADQAEFNRCRLQDNTHGDTIYYTLWHGDDVISVGSADTIRLGLRAHANQFDPNKPQSWEPSGYSDV